IALGGSTPPSRTTLEASMKVAVEEMESCKRRLVVEAPADVVTKEWERAYDRVQKQARLPGFRKGHVPRSLVKVHFADDVRPEVDQAVAGMRTGEQRQVGFRLPDDYRKETLRGKSGTGELKLIEVKEKILPELNDDFAKSLGEFATLEALRAEVVKQLEARRASEERHAVEEKVVDTLLGRHAFAVPESMIMRQIAHQVEHARERMRRQGVDPEGVQWDYP